jgi:hypothetical protein
MKSYVLSYMLLQYGRGRRQGRHTMQDPSRLRQQPKVKEALNEMET